MPFRIVVLFAATAFAVGCNQEPETPREKAEQAQKELEKAREDAAEMIAEAEDEAVETVSDAREDAESDLQKAKREAAEKVEKAERDLEDELDQLSDPGFVEDEPPAVREEAVVEEPATEEPPKIRVEIDGKEPR